MQIMVWTANGIPARLVWEDQRCRVNDTPTPLSPDDIFELTWHPAMTHPLPAWHGWRFQAINEQRVSLMFDVREGNAGAWHLLRVWDYDGAMIRRDGTPSSESGEARRDEASASGSRVASLPHSGRSRYGSLHTTRP